MSHHAVNMALSLRHPELSPSEMWFLTVLADYMNPETWDAYPGQKTLAERVGVSERSALTYLAKFEGLGLIVRQPRFRENGTRTSDLIIWQPAKFAEHTPPAKRRVDQPQTFPDQPANFAELKPASEPRKDNQDEELTLLVAGGDQSPARQAFDAWNEFAEAKGKAKALKLNDQRRRALNARLKECGGVAEWRRVISEIPSSAFLMGSTHHRFVISLDFLLQPSSFVKLLEGRYHGQQQSSGAGSARSASRFNAFAEGFEDGARDFLRRHGGGAEGA